MTHIVTKDGRYVEVDGSQVEVINITNDNVANVEATEKGVNVNLKDGSHLFLKDAELKEGIRSGDTFAYSYDYIELKVGGQ